MMTGTRGQVEDTGGVKVTISKGDKTEVLEAPKALMATGFAPRLEVMAENLEGLKTSDKGGSR